MPEPDAKPVPNSVPPDGGPALMDGPPEEEFWERYNKRLEFPLSTVSAVLIHVLVGAVLIFILVRLMDKETDKSDVPVKLMTISGLDDSGDGSPGEGGFNDPIVRANNDPATAAIQLLADPTKLPEIKDNMRQSIKYLDPTGNLAISDATAPAYASLDEATRKILLGARQGSGKGDGSGYDNTPGKGPGGTGADSTLGRSLRWVLRFRVTGGRDYLDQLRAMEAKILVPMPNGTKHIFFPDLNDLSIQRVATDDDMKRLANLQQFSDSRRDAVQGVAGALGLDYRPQTFWAFFPKHVEEELASKETGFRNRRSEDIEETIFRVTVRGGKYEIVVDEQKIKR